MIQKRRVRCLLMGGQACILYGAAEFSRDLDLAVLADARNLERLWRALRDLHAEPVYVPAMSTEVLRRGHACHFRAGIAAARDVRIDIMSVLHGCEPFPVMWARRQRLRVPDNGWVNVLSLPDLVQAKKTQRDKDWPMLSRLVESDYQQRARRPSRPHIDFWLREARTWELLLELCQRFPAQAGRLAAARPLLHYAIDRDHTRTEKALRAEQDQFQAADRAYWEPLKEELFHWRQQRRSPNR
jgi:hypothetical protein